MTIGIEYRFQIAAICFLVLIIFDYARRRKLALLSTRLFNYMLIMTGVNLVFDVLTVYTINHLDIVPAWLNRLCHQIFLGSLDATMFFVFYYIEVIGNNQRRFSNKMKPLVYTPIVVALIATIFADLDYIILDNAAYSMGPMAYILYVVLVVYVVFILYDTYKFRDRFSKRFMNSIRISMGVIIAIVIIQTIDHSLLISGLGITMVVFFLYLSFENPAEQMDENTESFNQKAFDSYVSEQFYKRKNIPKSFKRLRNKSFYVVNVRICDYYQLYNQLGRNTMNDILREVNRYLGDFRKTCSFRIHSNSMTFVTGLSGKAFDKQMERVCERFTRSWYCEDNKVIMKTHIDVIECPRYAASTDSVDALLNYLSTADIPAVLGGQYSYVNEELIKKNKRYQAVEELVREAVANDGFEVFYQPIFSVQSNRFESAEALVRLKDRETIGFVSPEEFIPMAEKNGLIAELGAIVFEKVCSFIGHCRPQDYGLRYIEVNISGIQGIDPGLPSQLKSIMNKYGVSPDFINLEITETAAVESGELLLENMKKLRDMGCSFSMDDFGTGYSNLSQMSEIEYDLIKLDKSLIWPCFEEDSKRANKILSCVSDLILGLGCHIVAEGVETQQMVDLLKELGVHYMQGYFYSRPIDEASFLNFIKEKNVR